MEPINGRRLLPQVCSALSATVIATFATACTTTPDLPDNPGAAEKLRKPESNYEMHGEIGVSYGRSG